MKKNQRGVSVVEVLLSMTVVSIGIAGGFAALTGSSSQVNDMSKLHRVRDSARMAFPALIDVIQDSNIDYIDTTSRTSGSVGVATSSDRFTGVDLTLRQCENSECTFHFHPSLSNNITRKCAGYEYRSGAAGSAVQRGKVLPSAFSRCPFDLTATSTSVVLDVMRLIVPRDATNALALKSDGTPNPLKLVFLGPVEASPGNVELRRVDLDIADLAAATSSAWSEFSTSSFSWIDILDTGTDGTTTTTKDNSVPVTLATSDATAEAFNLTSATVDGVAQPCVVWTKTVGTVSSYPYRSISLTVGLSTGAVAYNFDLRLSAGTYWRTSGTANKNSQTVVSHLTELALSTPASDPYHATTNPLGVSDAGVVRLTIGTSLPPNSGERNWTHHLESFALNPRNR